MCKAESAGCTVDGDRNFTGGNGGNGAVRTESGGQPHRDDQSESRNQKG